MPKRVVGRIVSPPEGWMFDASGELSPTGPFNATTFDALYKWAKEKGYGLTPNLGKPFYQDGFRVICRYAVMTESWSETVKWLGEGTWAHKDVTKSLGDIQCMREGIPYFNMCAGCENVGLATWMVLTQRERRLRLCSNCTQECIKCSTRFSRGNWVGDRTDECLECCPRDRCRWCSKWHPTDQMKAISGGKWICNPCASLRACANCGGFEDERITHREKKICIKCYGEIVEKERIPLEAWKASELPVGGSLRVESLSNRPVRVISIETEVDGDPTMLANTLYNEGVVREAFVESYGTGCPDTSQWPAFLKYDGSVSGGELICFLLQLDKKEHAESLKNVLSKLRSLEKMDKVSYPENCGGHIHIDAHNFSTDNVWRLVTGYNYLEDVIFRLAGAGHAYGHRTLVEGHDRANHGGGYSHPTVKGPWGIKSSAYRAIYSQNRMTGLNFQPYIRAVGNCGCGAGAENLRRCKCTLPKCTIEWRVWNSQGNPRILHAWIAFMQALHAWADSPREMTDEEEKSLPPFAWTKLPWVATGSGHKVIAHERVEWIFKHLVFTEAERDSLTFAFKQTDMEFPAGFWNKIAQIPTPKNRTVKAPRNCTIRPEKIEVMKPERKVFGNPRNDPAYMARGAVGRARARERNIRDAIRYEQPRGFQ